MPKNLAFKQNTVLFLNSRVEQRGSLTTEEKSHNAVWRRLYIALSMGSDKVKFNILTPSRGPLKKSLTTKSSTPKGDDETAGPH